MFRVIIDCDPYCGIKDPVNDAKNAAVERKPVLLDHILQHVAKDIVFGHHLVDVEAIFQALQAVSGRAVGGMDFGHAPGLLYSQRLDQFLDKIGIWSSSDGVSICFALASNRASRRHFARSSAFFDCKSVTICPR